MATALILRGKNGAALGLGYGLPVWPHIDGKLYAGYMHGTGQEGEDTYDYSLNERALSLIGDVASIRSAGYSTPTTTKYYSTPFRDTDILAAGTADEWTWCGVAKAGLAADGTMFSAEHPSDLAGFRGLLTTSGTFGGYAYDTDGPSGAAGPTIAFDAADSGEFEFFSISYADGLVTIRRKGPNTIWRASTATPDEGLIPSGLAFLIGRRTPNTSNSGGIALAASGYYSSSLTETEIKNTVYPAIQTILSDWHGIDV